jgi:hypothetical protein
VWGITPTNNNKIDNNKNENINNNDSNNNNNDNNNNNNDNNNISVQNDIANNNNNNNNNENENTTAEEVTEGSNSAREVAGIREESTNQSSGDEPALGSFLWARLGAHDGRFWFSRRVAVASGVTRLARGRISKATLVAEKDAQADRDECDVSASQRCDGGTSRA